MMSYQNTTPTLLVNKPEAARLLGISTRKLEQLIADNTLAARHIGRRVFIHRVTLERFAQGKQR
jgi:excisionase family DNA binding protein